VCLLSSNDQLVINRENGKLTVVHPIEKYKTKRQNAVTLLDIALVFKAEILAHSYKINLHIVIENDPRMIIVILIIIRRVHV
jgi:hypothetical protein